VRYFLDHCISFRYAGMLRALEVDIVALQEKCPANIKDVDLFKFLKGSEYVFISEDRRQLTRIAEATELRAAGISAIYFGPYWSGLGFWKQAEYLIKHWSSFESVHKGLAMGSITEAKQNGKLMTMP